MEGGGATEPHRKPTRVRRIAIKLQTKFGNHHMVVSRLFVSLETSVCWLIKLVKDCMLKNHHQSEATCFKIWIALCIIWNWMPGTLRNALRFEPIRSTWGGPWCRYIWITRQTVRSIRQRHWGTATTQNHIIKLCCYGGWSSIITQMWRSIKLIHT